MRPLVKIIDLGALRANVARLKHQSTPASMTSMMAVVKANAYGHGAATILPALAQVEQLAVASIDEALALRELGAIQPIVLLEGIFAPEEIPLCHSHHFIPFIHHQRQIQWLQNAKSRTSSPLRIWLKIDSGMHRLGIAIADAPRVIQELQSLTSVDCIGIASHFACADEQDLAHTQSQLAAMSTLDIPQGWLRCYANSAAMLQLPNLDSDWVRPGLAIYGMSPLAHCSAASLGLKAVMRLQTEILDTHYLLKGNTAGYGQGFTAPQAGTLATIALGYGDGFPRNIASGAVHVSINHHRYPIVGRVSMDMSLVWLGDDQYDVGTRVLLWGEGHDIETRAQEAETIPYTLTTALTQRVPTRIING